MHSLNRFFLFCFVLFFKNGYALLVFCNRIAYMQISDMISGVKIVGRKVSVASVKGAGGLGVF